ncbi:hypothetical protein LIA77_11255 [Sarocladium implicatum]|nr:hypothetical protein LIA77_11255 [Sarocladium implicatum]
MSGQPCIAKDLVNGNQPLSGQLGTILDNSAHDGFHQWGFVILRGVYGNSNAEWETFLALYKAAIWDELHYFGLADELGPHLQFTIVEDRAVLEDVSKDAARARFLEWVDEQRCGELADRPRVLDSHARFRYCIYINEVCLKTMTARLDKYLGIGERWCLDTSGHVVIIHALHEDHEPEEPEEPEEEEEEEDAYDEYPLIEGNTQKDVGWAYIEAIGHAELYSNLSSGGSIDQIWYGMVYRGRRPYRDPEPKYDSVSQPLSAVPREGPFGEHAQHSFGGRDA